MTDFATASFIYYMYNGSTILSESVNISCGLGQSCNGFSRD